MVQMTPLWTLLETIFHLTADRRLTSHDLPQQGALKACLRHVLVSKLTQVFVWVRAACDISARIFKPWTHLKFSGNVWANFGDDVNQYVPPFLALAFHQCLTAEPKQPPGRRFMITQSPLSTSRSQDLINAERGKSDVSG